MKKPKLSHSAPILLNSLLFLAGLLCLLWNRPLLCAACLLALSLLFVWTSGAFPRPEDDTQEEEESAQEAEIPDDPVRTELSLRVRELTEENALLTEKNKRLAHALKKAKEEQLSPHPLYTCALISALPVDLDAFFKAYLNDHKDSFQRHGLSIAYDCSAPGAQTCLAPSALTTICDDLFDNIIKFSRKGSPVYLRITEMAGDALIIMKNLGEGIWESELECIFELNYQGSNHMAGTGLGLAQVKAIIDDFGGLIWAKSTQENGFALYLQLPYRQRKLIELPETIMEEEKKEGDFT